MDEFKLMEKFQLPDAVTRQRYHGGFSGMAGEAWTALVFNLCTDPKEEESVAIRHVTTSVPLVMELARYKQVLNKHPPRHQASLK